MLFSKICMIYRATFGIAAVLRYFGLFAASDVYAALHIVVFSPIFCIFKQISQFFKAYFQAVFGIFHVHHLTFCVLGMYFSICFITGSKIVTVAYCIDLCFVLFGTLKI